MMWLKTLMAKLDFLKTGPMFMHCNNQTTIYIAKFHEWTKHIKVDCHFVQDCVMSKMIRTLFTPSEQLTNIFTKTFSKSFLDIV